MDMKPIVYVVQQQFQTDPENKSKLIPKFNFDAAKEYGELKFLLSPQANPFSIELVKHDLYEKLQLFQQKDYLLLVGNPILMSVSAIVACKIAGNTIQFLQWSGKDRRYIRIKYYGS